MHSLPPGARHREQGPVAQQIPVPTPSLSVSTPQEGRRTWLGYLLPSVPSHWQDFFLPLSFFTDVIFFVFQWFTFFPLLSRASNQSVNKTWALTPEIPVPFFKALHTTQIVGIELVVFYNERIALYLIHFLSHKLMKRSSFFSPTKASCPKDEDRNVELSQHKYLQKI